MANEPHTNNNMIWLVGIITAALIGLVAAIIGGIFNVDVIDRARNNEGTSTAIIKTVIFGSTREAIMQSTETKIAEISVSHTMQLSVTVDFANATATDTITLPSITPYEPTLTDISSASPTMTLTPTPQPTTTNTQTSAPLSTVTPRPTPTLRPTPLGLGDAYVRDNVEVELVDYRFTARNAPDEAAIWLALRFINNGTNPVEIRFAESNLIGISNDGESYTDFVTSFRHYIESEAPSRGCFYVIGFDFPDPNVTLYLEANENQVYELYLHRDGVDPQETCPQTSALYISRVSIGSSWVDISLPIDYQNTGERSEAFRATWRLVRP